jgi:predicted acylesterase/phospholipase RssA
MDIQEINFDLAPDVAVADSGRNRPLEVALVLSGGGAKGSFEVGALQYLYTAGFFARTICGTSVGAVNALQLAHGGTPAAQAAACSTLVGIWAGISPTNPFFVQTTAVSQALRAMRGWVRLLEDGFDPFDVIVWPIGAAKAASVFGSTASAIGPALQARALFDMSPLRRMISAALNPVAVRTSGVSLRLCAVSLESGEVRYVDEAGRLLNRELKPLPTPLGLAPECQDEFRAYRAAVANKAGIKQSNYFTAGGWDRTAYLQDVAEANRLVGQAKQALDDCEKQHPPVPQPLGLADGTMASSAIPVLFPPVALADEHYVDGGVMVQLPIEAAVRANPDVVVAISTGKLSIDRKEGFGTANVAPIAERAVFDLLMFEAMARQIELAEGSGITIFIVAPRFDVHGTLDQDPGLIAINMGYGYMCAADIAGDVNWSVTVPAGAGGLTAFVDSGPPVTTGRRTPTDPILAGLADTITRARMICWDLEYEVAGERRPLPLFGQPPLLAPVANVDALDRLRELKTLVRVLMMTRSALGGLLPPTSASWWSSYEAHDFQPLGTPWDEFHSRSGDRSAATAGTALVVVDEAGSNFLLSPPGRFPITNIGAVLSSGQPVQVSSELISAIPLGPPI